MPANSAALRVINALNSKLALEGQAPVGDDVAKLVEEIFTEIQSNMSVLSSVTTLCTSGGAEGGTATSYTVQFS